MVGEAAQLVVSAAAALRAASERVAAGGQRLDHQMLWDLGSGTGRVVAVGVVGAKQMMRRLCWLWLRARWWRRFRIGGGRFYFGSCPEVMAVPGRVSGAWTIGDSRTPLYVLFANIGDMTPEEFCDQIVTSVTPEQVRCVLRCLSEHLSENRPG